jgi:hypothetical protein
MSKRLRVQEAPTEAFVLAIRTNFQQLPMKDRYVVLNELLKMMPSCLEKCDQCGRVSGLCENECDAYKNNKETLCERCARWCSRCETWFGKSGAYKHECCVLDTPESEASPVPVPK